MKRTLTILFLSVIAFFYWETANGQIRINEIRADDDGGDDAEFIELIGIRGTDITGYQIVHYNGASSSDTDIFSHTIGSFTIPDDGIIDSNSNSLGFYVLGTAGFSTGTDESISDGLQNGPDGIVLYDDEGNILDAVAWEGAGDLTDDDPGTVFTSGSPEADNYLHVTMDDDSGDNSLQAPNNVVGDNGSGWTLAAATIGSINSGQSSGSIVINSSIKSEPANHVTSFTATGQINSVELSWTDATGSPEPDAYLIKASDSGFGSITDPTDTNPEPDDVDVADGSGALNINYGVESAFFSGLNETTTYYFKIYSYTNTGSDIDYRMDGTIPQDAATTLETPDIILNEILSDPDGDANGDGTTDSDDDEFLEFVNTGSTNLDISSWTIEDANGTTHTFDNPTILKPRQAVVIFGGGTPTGDFGGAVVQTTSSLSLNNDGDDVILKNDSGVEIFNIHYSGASNQSETRSQDLTGNFTNHSSADPDGSSFSPGTRADGFPFHPRITLTGSEGWRMLSTPMSDRTFSDLVENLWTQCALNSDYNGSLCSTDPDTGPNILTYDTDSDAFIGISDVNSPISEGEGFIIYAYSDDDYDHTADGFPKILEMFGPVNSGDVSPTLNSGVNSWTLLGNPYLSPISWESITKTGLTGTVYLYDHSYGTIDGGGDDTAEENNGIGGGYRTWNGVAGSLTDGIIAPMQGFWVQNAGASASLTFQETDQVTGGTFYSKEFVNSISIRLRAEMENLFDDAFITFQENGSFGKDPFDGLELSPIGHGDYLSLATEVNGEQMDINNLPVDLNQPVDIPINIQSFDSIETGHSHSGGKITLSWPNMENLPENWSIHLKDLQSNRTINLGKTDKYEFTIHSSNQKVIDKTHFTTLVPQTIELEKTVQKNRLILSISPNTPRTGNTYEFPYEFNLEQNYPNPFNPVTSIRYEVSRFAEVELSIYNVMGQRLATLVDEEKAPGLYEVTWNASDFASGIYYYRLQAGGKEFNRQMTLIK